MFEELKIIQYPDPRLKRASVEIIAFDAELRALATRMLELMREAKGVGLAAPQVGRNVRLFVMNPTGEAGDDRIYVNPVLSDPQDGEEEAEEGCLSLPDIHADVLRNKSMRMDAFDLQGKPLTETQKDFIARVWQHEIDHLNGTLLIDRMGPLAKMAARKTLRELEEKYAAAHPAADSKRKLVRKR
jgi:peptide deformylase